MGLVRHLYDPELSKEVRSYIDRNLHIQLLKEREQYLSNRIYTLEDPDNYNRDMDEYLHIMEALHDLGN